jgi:PAS domain S-box-containing protein
MAEAVPVTQGDPRLEQILRQIVHLASGDFEQRSVLSEKGDEYDAILAGLNLLAEELGAKNKFIEENRKKVNAIMEALIRSTQLDFSQKMEISDAGDEFDAIALGLNTMCEELESHILQLDKSQQEIKHTLHQLTEAQHIAHIGSWEWNVAANTIEWSDELYRIYGREKDEFEASFENYMNFIHPADSAQVSATIQNAMVEKKPFSFAHRIVLPDNSEKFLDCKGEIYLDELGNVARLTGTAQDVTELRKAEEKSVRLAAIVESSGDAIISKTLDGMITSWNKQAEILFGYTPGEAIGKHISLLFPVERLSEEDMILGRIRQGKAIPSYETERVKKDGTVFPMSATISPVFDSYGNIIGASKIVRDITEKKEAERKIAVYTQQLEHKTKETEQFAYVASHDLQEPLRTITNYIGLFEEDFKDKLGEDGDMYLRFINGAANRMKVLISDLLEYTRLENNTERAAVDCNKLVHDIIEDMDAAIKETGAHITHDELPVIIGYASRLRSLFQNLLSNAIKFRKPDVQPVIKIGVLDKGKEWLFSISDNGIGMDQAYGERIFLLFQRLHSRSEYSGTGIGLAHCKKIVELRGGKIWVESALGAGSTFYFTLPKSIE